MKTAIALLITMALGVVPLHGEATEQPPPAPAQEQPEVLTRGPIHEAFAEPVELESQRGLVAPTPPPANIVESPPEERPAGRQFVWVPGYWAWDSERNSYIWLSGCWRAAPPNRYWVPGYWFKTEGGWEWVPGFWAPVASPQEIEYLPAPPAIVDVQPPGPPPTPDNIWVPPCWYWYQGGYIWRPGYWVVARADWIWVPSHYVWTPRGYVFVAGHWDYSLVRRGVLFAPIYFPRPVYVHPGFSYSLSVVVDIGMLQFSLFTCPRYSHFYFGDYYDDVYIGIGIFPRFECQRRHTWYDPIYEHDRWRHHRVEPGWAEHERREYDRRKADRDLRPPRTYSEMEYRQARMPESERRSIQIAEPLSAVVADKRTSQRFKGIKTDEREKLSREATRVQSFGEERSRWESTSAGPQTSQPRKERERPVTPPTERTESVTPPEERKAPVTSSTGHREPAAPSGDRDPKSVPPQEVNLDRPERVTIPDPPIADKQRGLGIFRKSPPSRPADEQRTDPQRTPRDAEMPKDREAPRDRDAPRERR